MQCSNFSEPPYLDTRYLLGEVRAVAGERVKFDVPYRGEPCPEIVWTKDGSDAPMVSSKSQAITLSTTPTHTKLAFNNVTKAQEGTYTLTATNETGKETVSVTISVRDRPCPPEGLVTSLDGEACQLLWKKSRDDGGASIEYYQVKINTITQQCIFKTSVN